MSGGIGTCFVKDVPLNPEYSIYSEVYNEGLRLTCELFFAACTVAFAPK